MSTPMLQIVQL